jgi:hypothetical protein
MKLPQNTKGSPSNGSLEDKSLCRMPQQADARVLNAIAGLPPGGSLGSELRHMQLNLPQGPHSGVPAIKQSQY